MAIETILKTRLLEAGFTPIVPPLLVRERSLFGTSHFPEGRDQVYEIKADYVEDGTELFLVGSSSRRTSATSWTAPSARTSCRVRVFAVTPCFRSEAGAWGKDVRGIKRVHQFDKIEMDAVCTPDQAEAIYEQFREVNEWLLQTLELPYHVIEKCSGDAGLPAPTASATSRSGCPLREYMEVMTDTNAGLSGPAPQHPLPRE